MEVVVNPLVDCPEVASPVVFRLRDDAVLVEDGLVFVVVAGDKTFCNYWWRKLRIFRNVSKNITQHGRPRVLTTQCMLGDWEVSSPVFRRTGHLSVIVIGPVSAKLKFWNMP